MSLLDFNEEKELDVELPLYEFVLLVYCTISSETFQVFEIKKKII